MQLQLKKWLMMSRVAFEECMAQVVRRAVAEMGVSTCGLCACLCWSSPELPCSAGEARTFLLLEREPPQSWQKRESAGENPRQSMQMALPGARGWFWQQPELDGHHP